MQDTIIKDLLNSSTVDSTTANEIISIVEELLYDIDCLKDKIKELNEEIEEVESTISTLENKLSDIRNIL